MVSVFLNPFKALGLGVLDFSERVANTLWPAPAVAHANHLADFEAMVEVLEPRCGTCHQELDADGECAWERLVEAAATTPAAQSAAVEAPPQTPPAADLTWEGWAVPAILEVLAEHEVRYGVCGCGWNEGPQLYEWADHVAPLIAARIGCDPARAAAALQTYTPNEFQK